MKSTPILLAAGVAALIASCSSSGDKQTVEVQDTASNGQSVASTMASSGRFEVLSSALLNAGVAGDLASEGPFTVFVVSDESLEPADIEALMDAGGLTELDSLALFHVVPGLFSAEQLADEATITTLTGQRLRLSNWNGMVEVQSFGADEYGLQAARVVEADLFCDNGVIHVIDRPLVPSFETLADHLDDAGIFRQLLRGAERAGLLETFTGDQPFTVFAPTDAAFESLDPQAVAALIEDREALTAILGQHVVPGRIYADTLHHQPLETVAGTTIDVTWSRGRAFIGEIELVATDFEATNGVLHVISGVLAQD